MKPHSLPFSEAHLAGSRRAIGSLLREARELDDDQIERILTYQRERGVRFGEAAVALRLADRRDVVDALSRQFQYTAGFAGRQADSELVTASDPFSDQADAFRELRSRLLLEVLPVGEACSLAVVSPEAGDGKTYLAANLAVAFSQLGERTLLIDADLRTPRQHELVHIGYRAGLSGALAGFVDVSDLIHKVPGLEMLYLMPAGAPPPNPLELLQRPAFARLVDQMRDKFDRVIVDTSAAKRGPDCRAVAARCTATLVVARRSRSRMRELQGLVDALSRGPTKVAGVIMNEH